MREKCMKKVIAVQLALVFTLLTAVVVAYFVQSNKPEPTTLSEPTNASSGEDISSLFDDNSKQVDDLFISTVEIPEGTEDEDDDFIATVEQHEIDKLFERNGAGNKINGIQKVSGEEAELPLSSEQTKPADSRIDGLLQRNGPPKRTNSSDSNGSGGDKNNNTTQRPSRNSINKISKQEPPQRPVSMNRHPLKQTKGSSRSPSFVPSSPPSESSYPSSGPSTSFSEMPSQSPSGMPSQSLSNPPSLSMENPFLIAEGMVFAATQFPSVEPSIAIESDASSILAGASAGLDPSSNSGVDDNKSWSFQFGSDFSTAVFDKPSSSPPPLVSPCPPTYEAGDGTPCVTSNSSPSQVCFYDFSFVGCTWATLGCSPKVRCDCGVPMGGDMYEGLWSCTKITPVEESSCNLRRSAGLPELGETCDPDDMLPTPSTTTTTTTGALPVAETAPHSKYPIGTCPHQPGLGSCDIYSDEYRCNYDFVYTGCSWDAIACTPSITCDCNDGAWKCAGNFVSPCLYNDGRLPPEGLPWGKTCDPIDPLPTSLKKSECPESFELGKCDEYEENLECEFKHVYKGCTWNALSCSPAVECKCQDGNWQCSADFAEPCEGQGLVTPEGLPWGQECDPYGSLPFMEAPIVATSPTSAMTTQLRTTEPSSTPTSPPSAMPTQLRTNEPSSTPTSPPSAMPTKLRTNEPSSTPTVTPTHSFVDQLARECPDTFQFGECYQTYALNLQCAYDYVYNGCTWEDLTCRPSIECICDHWSGYWQCKSNFDNCSSNVATTVPQDLPLGQPCHPGAA